MPVSIHTDDDAASPRTELLSPLTSLSQSQSSSGRARPPRRSHGWKDRERELLRNRLSQKELVRLIIDSERESAKLHSTLSNTLNLLDEESRKCAALERDTFANFTRFNSAREAAQTTADNLARDLRVAQFELEHARREAERLKDEAEAHKKFRDELEAEYIKVKDLAHQYKRERLINLARDEGRREGFAAGFKQAQTDGLVRRRATEGATAEPAAGSQRGHRPPPHSALRRPQRNEPRVIPSPLPSGEEQPFEEMPSVPIISPPEHIMPPDRGHLAPTHTGYSPKRPVPRSRAAVDRSHAASPSIDHYEVSIPPQDVIEQTQNISQPAQAEAKDEWVTGQQHREINDRIQDAPIGNFTASNENHHPRPRHVSAPSIVDRTAPDPEQYTPMEPHAQAQGSKFRIKPRRPSLKQTAASWYRTFSLRKKLKQKVVIDPPEGDTAPITPITPATAESGPGPETSTAVGPETVSNQPPGTEVQPNKRHSKSASFGGSVARRDIYSLGTGRRHRPGASMDSIPMSQFEMLGTPLPGAGTGYPGEAGPSNVSVASVNTNGAIPSGKSQAPSISGRSGKSQGNGIGKKLSVITENPLSRGTTPLRPIEQQVDSRAQGSKTPQLYKRPSALEDRRSMKSGRSAASRMVAVNPDPESPDLNAQGQTQPLQIYSQQPPPGNPLQHHASTNLAVMAPLRTKRSSLSATSGSGPLETPTPMPRMGKGKGRELVPPEVPTSDSPGIKITVQAPSDPGQVTPHLDHFLGSSQHDGPSHSTPRLTRNNAILANEVQGGVTRSTPKIFQAQNLPEKESNEDVFIPRVTIRKRLGPDGYYTTNNAGMTPGLVLHQPLPSRVSQFQENVTVGHVHVPATLGADLAGGLHRTGSSSSLRSQGSYGKFDPRTYQDPALWAAPPGAFDRPRSDISSKRISYADPQ